MSGYEWYKRFPLKYFISTGRLTMIQDGAYNRLLDYYYMDGPIHPEKRYKIARAMTKSEEKSVDFVLKEYFTLLDDGLYHQLTADEIITERAELQEKRRAVGRKGGIQKSTKSKQLLTNCLPIAKQMPTKRVADLDLESEEKREETPKPLVPVNGVKSGKPKPAPKVKVEETHCPDDFTPDEGSIIYAKRHDLDGLEIEYQTGEFLKYYCRSEKGKKKKYQNWQVVFKDWITSKYYSPMPEHVRAPREAERSRNFTEAKLKENMEKRHSDFVAQGITPEMYQKKMGIKPVPKEEAFDGWIEEGDDD